MAAEQFPRVVHGGRYRLERLLGQGGVGRVYLAQDLRQNQKVAIKLLQHPAGGKLDASLLIREFAILSGLSHPHLASILDCGFLSPGELFFISYQFVEGERIDQALAAGEVAQFLTLAQQLCQALDYIHLHGVLHLDLKPSNLLVSRREGRPHLTLLDFGSAVERHQRDQEISGTLAYLAPERIRGETIDARADLYSAGVLFYRLLSGCTPFSGRDNAELLRAHLEQESPPLRQINPAVSEALERVIDKLLRKKPALRFASARQLARALARCPGASPAAPSDQAEWINHPHFCGRQATSAELQKWAAGLEEPGAAWSPFILLGAAGLGKSRLLLEWRKSLLLQKQRDLLYLDLSAPVLAGVGQVESLLQEIDPQPALPLPAAGDGTTRYLQFEHLARRLHQLARQRPLFLALDGVERAAAADLELIAYLLRQQSAGGAGLGLILALRDGQPLPPPLAAALTADTKARRLALPPLSEEAARELLQSIFGQESPLPEKAAAWILKRGQGNPQLLQELVRLLMRQGCLTIDPQTEEVECPSLPEDTALPHSLTDLARQSLAGIMDSDSGEVFLDLALSPQGMRETELAQRLGFSPAQVNLALARLVRLGLVTAEGVYFRPAQRAVWREILQTQLPGDEWRRRHLALGQFWRSRWQQGAAPAAAAFMLLDQAKAWPLAAAPGYEYFQKSLAAGNTAEARATLEKLLQMPAAALAQSSLPLPEMQLQRADLCIAQGDYPQALVALDSAQALAAEENAVTARRARLLQKQGRQEEAFRLLAQPSRRLYGEILEIAASTLLGLGRFVEALQAVEQGLAENPRQPLLLNLKGQALFQLERYRESRQAYEAALALSPSAGQVKGRLYAQSGLAALAQAAGDLVQAKGLLQQLIQQADQDGDVITRGQAYLQLGTLAHQAADYKEALHAYRHALEVAQQTGHAPLELRARLNLGNLEFFLGSFAPARATAGRALELARAAGDRQYEGFALMLTGLGREKEGQCQAASIDLKEARMIFQAISFTPGALQAELELARLGPAEEARTAFPRLLQKAEESGNREMALAALSAWGLHLAARRPASEETLSLLLRAKALAEQLREKRERAKLCAALCRVHQVRGHRQLAADAAAEAVELIESLHAALPEEYQEGFLRSLDYAAVKSAAAPAAPPPSRPAPAAQSSEDEPTVLGLPSAPQGILDKLFGILGRFQRSTNLEELLEEILEAAIQITGAQRGLILTGHPEELVVRVSRGQGAEELASPQFQFSRTAVEKVWREGRSLLTVDAESDRAVRQAKSVARLSLKSILCVPLFVLQRVEGVIYLDHRRKKGIFNEPDRQLLEILTSQASFALERAKMVQQLLDKNSQIQRLLEELEQRVTIQKVELDRVRAELKDRDQQLQLRYNYQNIIGVSERMQQVFRLLDRVTDKKMPVLIHGESGTGKELIARALHYNGPQQRGPFIAESCANIPAALFESEFFGHVKGAFTGASQDKIGLFEAAHGGTLFLDEIGEMPLGIQPKLLRALQEGKIRRLGGTATIPVQARIIAASNRNLKELAARGLFRQDLFYRLNVVNIDLPPLRQRREDIPLLARHFLEQIARREKRPPKKLNAPALALLTRYDWPGNVRELENELESLWLLSGETIEVADLPDKVRGQPRRQAARRGRGTIKEMVDQLEREVLLEVLEKYKGNKSQVARELGLSRLGLRKKMSRLGMLKPEPDQEG